MCRVQSKTIPLDPLLLELKCNFVEENLKNGISTENFNIKLNCLVNLKFLIRTWNINMQHLNTYKRVRMLPIGTLIFFFGVVVKNQNSKNVSKGCFE